MISHDHDSVRRVALQFIQSLLMVFVALDCPLWAAPTMSNNNNNNLSLHDAKQLFANELADDVVRDEHVRSIYCPGRK